MTNPTARILSALVRPWLPPQSQCRNFRLHTRGWIAPRKTRGRKPRPRGTLPPVILVSSGRSTRKGLISSVADMLLCRWRDILEAGLEGQPSSADKLWDTKLVLCSSVVRGSSIDANGGLRISDRETDLMRKRASACF